MSGGDENDGEPNKLQEAIDRISRFIAFVKSNVLYCVKVRSKFMRFGITNSLIVSRMSIHLIHNRQVSLSNLAAAISPKV